MIKTSDHKGFLNTGNKNECFGCGACAQICSLNAIQMLEDTEGFLYPKVDSLKCVDCELCHKVCPYENEFTKLKDKQVAFGGHVCDDQVLAESTSGGAFSAIVDAWCDKNYAIFGAKEEGLHVSHAFVVDKHEMGVFRKSKYVQSDMKTAYKDAQQFLREGKKVLFSGTPCQIAGLRAYLKNKEFPNLLTVEVICEGVPSPLFMRKYEEYLWTKYGATIQKIDYRYKDTCLMGSNTRGKWDFEVMDVLLSDGRHVKTDRWFNPFWSIWLKHLMSRPSCYQCPFATQERTADITLGDLWGVHLYCPELYNHNRGASLIVCNTSRGKDVLTKAKRNMSGHELNMEDALKYQSPMRKNIEENVQRKEFMEDLQNERMDYPLICKKWADKPTFKLLFSKYLYGNRQKVFFWNLLHNMIGRK